MNRIIFILIALAIYLSLNGCSSPIYSEENHSEISNQLFMQIHLPSKTKEDELIRRKNVDLLKKDFLEYIENSSYTTESQASSLLRELEFFDILMTVEYYRRKIGVLPCPKRTVDYRCKVFELNMLEKKQLRHLMENEKETLERQKRNPLNP